MRFLQVIGGVILSIWLAIAPAYAGSMTLLGAGKVGAAVTYQGPGDIQSSAGTWFSLARAYSSAQASTATNIADLVAVTGGGAVCTLRLTSSGFVDTSAYCPGSLTPAAACAAASGGSCKITKAYDQTGNGNHFTNGTLASMPAVTFSGLSGFPGIVCSNAAGSVLTGATSITRVQPISYSAVAERTGTTGSNTAIISASSTDISLGYSNAINQARLAGGAALSGSASDSSFHALNGTINGGSSSLYIDGSNTAGNAGASTMTTQTIRLCRTSGAVSGDIVIMEAGYWPADISANNSSLNSNQHGSTNGYNF